MMNDHKNQHHDHQGYEDQGETRVAPLWLWWAALLIGQEGGVESPPHG